MTSYCCKYSDVNAEQHKLNLCLVIKLRLSHIRNIIIDSKHKDEAWFNYSQLQTSIFIIQCVVFTGI